jgi:hypothetical protein
MKWLKTYKIFESSDKRDKFIDDITDICFDFEESGFDVDIRKVNYYPTWGENLIAPGEDKQAIAINLVDSHKRLFRLEDINPTLERIIQYFNSLNEKKEIHLSIPDEQVYLSKDYFLDEFSGEELYKLVIYIY